MKKVTRDRLLVVLVAIATAVAGFNWQAYTAWPTQQVLDISNPYTACVDQAGVREIDKTGGGALDRCSRWKVFLEDTLYSYGHSFNKHSTAIRYSRMVWLLRICVRYSSLFLKFLPRYHQSSFILTTAFFSSGDFSI